MQIRVRQSPAIVGQVHGGEPAPRSSQEIRPQVGVYLAQQGPWPGKGTAVAALETSTSPMVIKEGLSTQGRA